MGKGDETGCLALKKKDVHKTKDERGINKGSWAAKKVWGRSKTVIAFPWGRQKKGRGIDSEGGDEKRSKKVNGRGRKALEGRRGGGGGHQTLGPY